MSAEHPNRPLSPHLQVYRPQMTSMLSILHRMTGIANAIGLFVLGWGLYALAAGPESYATFIAVATHPVGLLMLFGWTFSVCYHLCNGIRHLIWDTGHLFDIKQATLAGYIVLAVAILMTGGLWFF